MEEQPRRSISRRDFCGWVLKGVGAATVGVVLEACGVRPSPKPPTQQPEQSAKQNPEPFYVGNHKIIFNSDGLPVECILEDGSKVVFDLNKVGMIKEKAKSSQEPELLELIPTSEPKRHPATEGLLEHPRIFEKPEDIFCEEELERIGIEVIQTDQVKLFIRKWAIEKGSPLEDFNNTGRKLVIVLVDKPHVLKTYLKDPKYDKVREFLTDSLIEESPETLRNQLLHYYNRTTA